MPTPLVTLARVLLGLPYLVLGLGDFVDVPALPNAAEAFIHNLALTSRVFPVAEVGCGVLLLLGWAQPLALVLLVPITTGIVGCTIGIGGGVVDLALPYAMGGLHLLLLLRHRRAWAGLFFSEVDEEE